MTTELPETIGDYEYAANKSGDDLDHCKEGHYYENGEHGISIVRLTEDDDYEVRSRRWGDAAHGYIMGSVPVGTYETLDEAVENAEWVFGSIRGVVARLRLEIKHATFR